MERTSLFVLPRDFFTTLVHASTNRIYLLNKKVLSKKKNLKVARKTVTTRERLLLEKIDGVK